MAKLFSSRDDKLRVLDLLKELIKALALNAMSEEDLDKLAKALFAYVESGLPMSAQLDVFANAQAMKIVIELQQGQRLQ